MKEEIEAAAEWWTVGLSKNLAEPETLKLFRQSLVAQLTERCTGHWYESEVQRGSGYRSVSFDQRMDKTLVKAGEAAGIKTANLEKHLNHMRSFVMFINPGEVKVRNTSLSYGPAMAIYRRGNSNSIPRSQEPVSPLKTDVSPSSPVDSTASQSAASSSPSSPSLTSLPKVDDMAHYIQQTQVHVNS